MVGGVRRQLNQAAICTLDLQAVMNSIPLALHIQCQLAGLLLDQTNDVEVAGSSHSGSKGDCQGKLATSRHCSAARLKGQHGLSACRREHAYQSCDMYAVMCCKRYVVICIDGYAVVSCKKESWEKLLEVVFVDVGQLMNAVKTSAGLLDCWNKHNVLCNKVTIGSGRLGACCQPKTTGNH